jgi:hypothetical protein
MPIADLIKNDMISVEIPEKSAAQSPQNSKELQHIKTIGLVNLPTSTLADLDKDISKI